MNPLTVAMGQPHTMTHRHNMIHHLRKRLLTPDELRAIINQQKDNRKEMTFIDTRKMTRESLIAEQKRLDEINSSGRYSFKQTIDENGHIHIDCDPETYAREMGYIPLEEHLKRLCEIVSEYTDNNNHQ